MRRSEEARLAERGAEFVQRGFTFGRKIWMYESNGTAPCRFSPATYVDGLFAFGCDGLQSTQHHIQV